MCSYTHCFLEGQPTDVCKGCEQAGFHYQCALNSPFWEDPLLAPALCQVCLVKAIVVDKKFSVSTEAF